MFRTIFHNTALNIGHRHSLWLGLLLIAFSPFISYAASENLFKKNMEMGQLFEKCGNMQMAEQYYQTALHNSNEKDMHEQLQAQLGIVSTRKFTRPVEASRLNEEMERASAKYPDCRQQYLIMNAFISFRLNDKIAFEKANKEYLALCAEHDNLPTTFDQILQAMNEALNGYDSNALILLSAPSVDPVLRHDVRTLIFQMKGMTKEALDEQLSRAQTIDSITTVMYKQNTEKIGITEEITKAKEKADKDKSNSQTIIIILLLLIVVMILIWMALRQRSQKVLKDKNEQLNAALKMANETDEMKTAFVRRVSHEIRTPLNAITGFNEILNNPAIELPQEERNDLMERINDNVKAITNIIDELLQVSNDESLKDYAKFDEVYCNQFFSTLLYNHRPDVNADVQLVYTTKVVNRQTILTNAEVLKKIMEHLIGNAIKFTQKGTIELNCQEQNNMLYLTLTDTGCGVPPDMQDKIFEQFTKVDAFQQGIGLGLTVSRKLAQKLGGTLYLDKDYTDGARFVLTITK